jgi:hypothetical protein
VFLAADIGLGLVHTLDMEAAAEAIESKVWPLRETTFAALVERFGYQLQPKAAAAPTSPR